MKIGDVSFGVFFLLSALFIFVYSIATFPVVPGAQFGPEFFPCLVSVLMGLSGIVLIVRGIAARDWVFDCSTWRGEARKVAAAVVMIGGILTYIVFLDALGFVLLAVANSTILMVVLGNRLLPSLLVSAAVTAVAYLVFTRLLYVPLPGGLFESI